jgi:hypothetical protein
MRVMRFCHGHGMGHDIIDQVFGGNHAEQAIIGHIVFLP